MTTPRAALSADELRELVAGNAKSEARFDEVFHRLAAVEKTSAEARDIGREIVTTLREQDALSKISEARSAATAEVAALRQDVVLANTNARREQTELAARILALENLREQGKGAASGVKWLWDALKVIAGMGGGALILKLLEHM